MSRFCAIVLSGGKGTRIGGCVPKQYMMLKDKPLLAHSLVAFERSRVDDIVIVCGKGEEEYIQKEFVDKYWLSKVKNIVVGGEERYDSVYSGLKGCSNVDYVLIHDGARPYVSNEIIERNMMEVEKHRAVVTAVRATDTVKVVDENGYIITTPDRNCCYMMQTPQTFEYNLVMKAYSSYMNDRANGNSLKVTDDAQVVELYGGCKVKVVDGDVGNIKITYLADFNKNF